MGTPMDPLRGINALLRKYNHPTVQEGRSRVQRYSQPKQNSRKRDNVHTGPWQTMASQPGNQ